MITVYHNKPSGWTYNVASAATPPVIYSMSTDYAATEDNVQNAQPGRYKRSGLSVSVAGSSDEGIIFALTQGGTRPYGIGTATMQITHC